MKASASPTITEYPLQSGYPQGITAGPDGALWFTQGGIGNNIDNIARITTSGAVTEHPLSSQYGVHGIAAGSDGALWFTEGTANRIARITTSGAATTEYPIPTTLSTPNNSDPIEITAGPDGALWFTDRGNGQYTNSIGRITTSGAITIYPLQTSYAQPLDITAGPDGALWFTEPYPNQIGRITTSGTITEYPIPTANSGSIYITAGPDGALWFTEEYTNRIGRITTSGAITEYPIPNYPYGITAGSDGALWFTEPGANQISRITTSGTITEYPLTGQPEPLFITSGSDGALWFTEVAANRIGRITTPILTVPSDLTASSPTQHPNLSWTAVAGVDSYNIYRNDVLIGSTSTSSSYTDNTAPEGTDTYYVTAVNSGGESGPSNSVSVMVDRTAPTITYSLSPAPNGGGWNNSDVTVNFTCDDTLSGVASCSSPVTVSTEGGNQTITGTAVDNAGNSQTTTVTVNLDKTAPTVSNVTLATDPLITASTTTLSANVSDSLSGINKAEYYTGTDPGAGNGMSMNISNGVATATVGPYFTPGMYTFYVRTQDNAGNWSQPMPVTLDVYNPASGYTAGHGFVTPNGGTSDSGDNLPTVTGANVKATFDFTVKYDTSTSTTPTGASTFTWGGGNCKKTANSCFVVNTDSLSWLIVPGDNTAIFEGLASLSLNGQSQGSNYPIRIRVIGTTPTYVGHYNLQIFQVGANPDTSAPIYQASGDLTGGSVVMHQ